MSAEDRKDAGHETLDAHAGATFKAGLYVLAAMFLVAAIVIPLYWLFARQEAHDQPRAATVLETGPSPAAVPRLVTDEPLVLAAFRAKEDAILSGYGWVEKDRAIARMPIGEALRIVGERGALPVFAAVPLTGDQATPMATRSPDPGRAAESGGAR